MNCLQSRWLLLLFSLRLTAAFVVLQSLTRHRSSMDLGGLNELTVEPDRVLDETTLSRLQELAELRAKARWDSAYEEADRIRSQMDEIALPAGFGLRIEDIPRKQGGGSTLHLVFQAPQQADESSPRVLHLAHSALGMAVSYSERGLEIPTEQLDKLVAPAKTQLMGWSFIDDQVRREDGSLLFDQLHTLSQESPEQVSIWSAIEAELRGRKPADATFWFALAGTNDQELLELLARICTKELERFGARPSARFKDIMAVANRLAAAGIRRDKRLESVLASCIAAKQQQEVEPLPNNLLDMHSDACALMIWKFATSQRKQRAFVSTAARHWESQNKDNPTSESASNTDEPMDWSFVFADPSRPLVVDLGCGMGVSLLGLASLEENDDFDWSKCNMLGGDLSAVAIAYADGIATRWDLKDRLCFVRQSAEALIQKLASYPGPIERVLIQFPTPYKLSTTNDGAGNSQLPTSTSNGFMVTPRLLELVHKSLTMHRAGASCSQIVLQSNCEDVAVWMLDTACTEAGFVPMPATDPVIEIQGTLTQRALNWIEMGGKRAIGPVWHSQPVLPRQGRTETEIACMMNDTPVHRTILAAAMPSE